MEHTSSRTGSAEVSEDNTSYLKNNSRCIIYSSEDMMPLARSVAEKAGIILGNIVRKTFVNGEKYYRFDISDRFKLVGRTVIYIASLWNDENIIDLFRIGTGLSEVGVARQIYIIPYLGYSTMERDVLPGEVVTARSTLLMMSAIPNAPRGNTFMFMDLHVAGLRRYMLPSSTTLELYAGDLLVEKISSMKLENVIVGSADLGRTKWVEFYARKLGSDMAFIRKSRSFDNSEVCNIIGDVKGKNVVIYDDMLRSGGTAIHAAEAYINNGAVGVYLLVSHFAVPASCIDNIIESPFKKIITTNSHPSVFNEKVASSGKIEICDISETIVHTLRGGGYFH